jgi:hypothetical protein
MSIHELISAVKPVCGILRAGKFFVLLLAAAALCGCARRYDVTLTNGQHLTNIRKPVRDKSGGFFYYVDGRGNKVIIPATRVVEIDPHQESKFKSPQ